MFLTFGFQSPSKMIIDIVVKLKSEIVDVGPGTDSLEFMR